MQQQKNVAGKRDERHDKNDVKPLELPHIHSFVNGIQHPSHDDSGDDPPEKFELQRKRLTFVHEQFPL